MSKIHPELSRWQFVMKLDEEARRARPWAFPPRDPNILSIEDVAGLLLCSVDQVRRIDRNLLAPRQGPGKRVIYIRSDVDAYADRLPARGGRKLDFATIRHPVDALASKKARSVTTDIDAALKRLSKRTSKS